MPSTHSPRKSPERAAFEHYLRTGEPLTAAEWLARCERKFNPYHDELGRFTSANGAAAPARMAERPKKEPLPPTLGSNTIGRPRRPAPPRPAPVPRQIAAMPGYPETGKTAWRSSNDAAFAAAADYYNQKYGLRPDQEEFRTPEFMKAWAMREAGGEGNERAFRTDPFQVNNPGDWPKFGDDSKIRIAGLRKGQRMTPAASAYSALEWLRYKSYLHDGRGRPIKFLGNKIGLQQYNTVRTATRRSGGLPHKVWYAETIIQMAAQAATARR